MSWEYFTEAELRALPDMGDPNRYTSARLSAAHDWIVGIIEREVGTSFVGRTITGEVYDGDGTDGIELDEPFVLSVTSATDGGVTVTDDLRIVGANIVRRFATGTYFPNHWTFGQANVVINYVAGYTATPPGDIKEAALKAARLHLLETDSGAAFDERRTAITNETGTTSLATAGTDRPTGYPTVDAVIVGWRSRLDVMGFA